VDSGLLQDEGVELYKGVLTALNEMGTFEDLLLHGVAQSSQATVGMYYSRANDIWGPTILERISVPGESDTVSTEVEIDARVHRSTSPRSRS
jgi:hypothetical protein